MLVPDRMELYYLTKQIEAGLLLKKNRNVIAGLEDNITGTVMNRYATGKSEDAAHGRR